MFYAQIRFRESREWVTVARAESRRSASEYARTAFRVARDDAGRSPVNARVLDTGAPAPAGDASRAV